MPHNKTGRVLFLKATATAPTTGTRVATSTDQSPMEGFITGVEFILPAAPVGKLRYALFRNDEQIYPENGYAERPISGSDDADVFTAISEGDNLTLNILNDDTTTDWTVSVKVTLESEGDDSDSERPVAYPDYRPEEDEDKDWQ